MDLSPLPILDAAESYSGRFVDLETGLTLSADQFHRGRSELAQQLRNAGLESGQRVVVSVGNGPSFVSTLLAVLSAGGCPLLLHARTPVAELKRTALRFGAPLIIAEEGMPDDFQAEAISVRTVAIDGWIELLVGNVDPGTAGFNAELSSLAGVPLHLTSGTTGQPKVAVRPGRAAMEEARHYIETIGISQADTVMAVAPMCHAYAYGMCVMVSLLRRCIDRFDARLSVTPLFRGDSARADLHPSRGAGDAHWAAVRLRRSTPPGAEDRTLCRVSPVGNHGQTVPQQDGHYGAAFVWDDRNWRHHGRSVWNAADRRPVRRPHHERRRGRGAAPSGGRYHAGGA